jgi:predicted nucleic acid-binding protein
VKYVIDASVAIKWVVEESGTEDATALMDHSLLAPDLFVSEIANVLWKKIRRRELTLQVAEAAALTLQAAGIELVPTADLLPEILRLAHTLEHPAYDCAYLAVALERKCPLVTADRELVKKCIRVDARRFSRHVTLLGGLAT